MQEVPSRGRLYDSAPAICQVYRVALQGSFTDFKEAFVRQCSCHMSGVSCRSAGERYSDLASMWGPACGMWVFAPVCKGHRESGRICSSHATVHLAACPLWAETEGLGEWGGSVRRYTLNSGMYVTALGRTWGNSAGLVRMHTLKSGCTSWWWSGRSGFRGLKWRQGVMVRWEEDISEVYHGPVVVVRGE